MDQVVNVILPVFAIMAAGYFSGRFGLFTAAATRIFNDFVFYIAFPAMIFLSMAQAPVNESLNAPLFAAFLGGVAGVALIIFVTAAIRRAARPADDVVRALNAAFANTGYIGVPLLAIAYGEAGLRPGLTLAVYNAALMTALGVLLIELDIGNRRSLIANLGNAGLMLIRNPLLLAAAAGVLWAISGRSLPAMVVNFSDVLGAAAPPVALFAIGLFMFDRRFGDGLSETLWLTALKLLAQPVITAWLAFSLLMLPPMSAAAAVICAALPTGSLVFVIAERYGILVMRSTAVILLSTVLSVFTLSVLLVLLAPVTAGLH